VEFRQAVAYAIDRQTNFGTFMKLKLHNNFNNASGSKIMLHRTSRETQPIRVAPKSKIIMSIFCLVHGACQGAVVLGYANSRTGSAGTQSSRDGFAN
jgi:hypothetical protein